MTNTQSPAPGVAAILSKLQEQEPIGYSGVERNDVDIGVTRDAVLRWVHADEEDEPLYSLAQIRTALQASAAAVPEKLRLAVDKVLSEFGTSSDSLHDLYQARKEYEAAPPLPAQAQEAEPGIAEKLRAALAELLARCEEVKAALDKDIPLGEPVHPLSSRLTWPMSTATGALREYASRTPAPGMAGGVVYTADLDASNKRALEEAPKTLARLIAGQPAPQSVGSGTTTSAPELLRSIANDLEIMLASATQHVSEETVTGYTIKTGALHRIIGTLVGNGFRVSIPLAPQPSPAPQAAGAAFDDGWRLCAKWARRDDLVSDMDSPAFKEAKVICLDAIAATGRAGS